MPGSYRCPQATSRLISELNPFGIFVSGVFLIARTVVRSIFKNNKMSNAQGNVFFPKFLIFSPVNIIDTGHLDYIRRVSSIRKTELEFPLEDNSFNLSSVYFIT